MEALSSCEKCGLLISLQEWEDNKMKCRECNE